MQPANFRGRDAPAGFQRRHKQNPSSGKADWHSLDGKPNETALSKAFLLNRRSAFETAPERYRFVCGPADRGPWDHTRDSSS